MCSNVVLPAASKVENIHAVIECVAFCTDLTTDFHERQCGTLFTLKVGERVTAGFDPRANSLMFDADEMIDLLRSSAGRSKKPVTPSWSGFVLGAG